MNQCIHASGVCNTRYILTIRYSVGRQEEVREYSVYRERSTQAGGSTRHVNDRKPAIWTWRLGTASCTTVTYRQTAGAPTTWLLRCYPLPSRPYAPNPLALSLSAWVMHFGPGSAAYLARKSRDVLVKEGLSRCKKVSGSTDGLWSCRLFFHLVPRSRVPSFLVFRFSSWTLSAVTFVSSEMFSSIGFHRRCFCTGTLKSPIIISTTIIVILCTVRYRWLRVFVYMFAFVHKKIKNGTR